jgi:hypothetical protein
MIPTHKYQTSRWQYPEEANVQHLGQGNIKSSIVLYNDLSKAAVNFRVSTVIAYLNYWDYFSLPEK